MSVFRRLLVSSFVLALAIPAARAQVVGLVDNTGSLTISGLTFTIGSCTLQTNGGATNPCAASDKLELLAVPSGRGTLSLEVIGYSGAAPGSATSAALTNTAGGGKSSILNFTLTASLVSGFPSTYLATDALFTTTGTRNVGSDSSTAVSTATVGPTLTLTDVLANQTAQQTVASGTPPGTASPFGPSNSFSITENLNLTRGMGSVSLLQFNHATLQLHTAPEPASIAVLLFGLGGLAMARRRRLS